MSFLFYFSLMSKRCQLNKSKCKYETRYYFYLFIFENVLKAPFEQYFCFRILRATHEMSVKRKPKAEGC